MAERKPNTICKNIHCTHGADGGRKHYYTCRYCVNTMNWRAVACCLECFEAYIQQVREARGEVAAVPEKDLLPERTDMSVEEVRRIVKDESFEDAFEQTKEELSDIFEEHPDYGIADAVDEVNRKLDAKSRRKK